MGIASYDNTFSAFPDLPLVLTPSPDLYCLATLSWGSQVTVVLKRSDRQRRCTDLLAEVRTVQKI